MSDLLEDLTWRGLVAQSTDPGALHAGLAAGPITLYGGFDPTADSLHVGSLVLLLTLRRFQQAGHRPIALVGGATGLIGDPSGRTSGERALKGGELVAHWAERIRGQVSRFLDLDGPAGALVVDNLEWAAPLHVVDFLRDVGKHFSVSTMLAKESVSARLGSAAGISFTEFSYMLLQALDFLELHRRYGCVMQLGGSDQWGNITAGLELIRRVAGTGAHGLTTPLVTDGAGQKFGKSEGEAVWLDPARTTPYAFYQFWVNTTDADAGRYLRLFTFLSRERIEELDRAVAERPRAREAQRELAREVTRLVHGVGELEQVELASRALFGSGDLAALDATALAGAAAAVPRLALPPGPLPSVVELLVGAGLTESRNEARRAVAQGGAYLNNRRVTDSEETPGEADLLHGRWLVLRRGARTVGMAERAL